jgi:hypothetical protein
VAKKSWVFLICSKSQNPKLFKRKSAIFILLNSHDFLSVFIAAVVLNEFGCNTYAIHFTTKKKYQHRSENPITKPMRLKWTFQYSDVFQFSFQTIVFWCNLPHFHHSDNWNTRNFRKQDLCKCYKTLTFLQTWKMYSSLASYEIFLQRPEVVELVKKIPAFVKFEFVLKNRPLCSVPMQLS